MGDVLDDGGDDVPDLTGRRPSPALRVRGDGLGGRYLTCGRTVWLGPDHLREVLVSARRARAWRTSRIPSTVKVGRYTFRRSWGDLTPESLEAVVGQMLLHGLDPGVSSWGGVWRRFAPRVHSPRASVRRLLARGTWPYNWIELRREPGPVDDWQEWDLASAYPWASGLGLPCAATLEVVHDHDPDDRAVHLDDDVVSETGEPEGYVLPPWLRRRSPQPVRRGVDRSLFESRATARPRPRWVHGEVLNKLVLRGTHRPYATVRWGRTVDLRPAFDRVREVFPWRWAWKSVLAAHWGGWIARRGCLDETWEDGTCVRSREIPTLANHLDAGTVQSRVHVRLAREADRAARVFIDSVVLPPGLRPSPVGERPGEWRPKGPVAEIRPLPRRPVGARMVSA